VALNGVTLEADLGQFIDAVQEKNLSLNGIFVLQILHDERSRVLEGIRVHPVEDDH
jgi:hypothetical protein